MAVLYFLCGIQGAGKTTFAFNNYQRLNATIISTDEIRKKYVQIEEKDVFPTAYKLIGELLNNGQNVIFDATNITKKVRNRHISNIKEELNTNIKIICYLFKTNLDECINRVNLRNKDKDALYLPLEVITSYYNNFQDPSLDEGFDEIIIIK